MGNRIVKNTAMLYIMNIAKLVFPLLTLPYLARVLSTEANAVYTYVKNSVLMYVQLIIDFGFMLSATKSIAQARGDKEKIGSIVGDVMVGKGILSVLAFAVLAVMTRYIGILGENPVYTLLSFVQAVTTIFLVDFLFHGLERMHIITIRYFITRVITVALTFLLIKDDSDLLLIPTLEIIGNLVAVLWVWWEIKKMELRVRFTKISAVWSMLKDSFVYFLSNMASTAFGALNTLIIGIVMVEKDIVIWGYAIQFVSVVQMMYDPVINGIYPHMVREKSFGVIRRVLMIFLPLIAVGCAIVWFGADILVGILTGGVYPEAAPVLRYFIPLLFISFPAMLFGWPVLGAIGKTKETTVTTVICAAVQVLGLVVLLAVDRFSLFSLAMLRAGTDLLMFILRGAVCLRHRKEFLS